MKKPASVVPTKFRRSTSVSGGYEFTQEEDGQFVILNKDGSVLCTRPTERAVMEWIGERRRERVAKERAAREAKPRPGRAAADPACGQRHHGDRGNPAGIGIEVKADDPAAITPVEYGGLQAAFDHLNAVLFAGALPDAFITYQRQAHSKGHFSPDRFSARVGKFTKPEIALNPDSFIDRTDEQIVSTLAHEMTHLRQQVFGKPSARGYHNREWAAMMKDIGLMPSSTGAVGGKETGQQMSHYIIPGGAYAQAFKELAAADWRLNLQSTIHPGGSKAPPSKVKFTCPSCGSNMWGKPDSKDICGECNQWRKVAAADASYDRQAAE